MIRERCPQTAALEPVVLKDGTRYSLFEGTTSRFKTKMFEVPRYSSAIKDDEHSYTEKEEILIARRGSRITRSSILP